MTTWFQNIAKQDGKRWPHFRGTIAKNWESRRKLRYEVCTGRRDFGAHIDCFGGDSLGDLQLSLHLLFISVWVTFESVLGWFPKDKQGRYRQPMTSGFRLDTNGFWLHLWNNAHEYASDGSTYLVNWHFNWPWTFASASIWEVQRPDGTFVARSLDDYPDRGKEFEWPYKDGRQMYQTPYAYTLRNGEVQNVMVAFFVDRMVWYKRYQKWPLMGWAKWPKIDRKSINLTFSAEVGERAGSWKGGCIGCSYEMLPGERPIDTVRRMEREREFS